MTIKTRFAARAFRLPKALTRRVIAERDIRIPMPDGIALQADRWYPARIPADQCPIVLMTTCYQRSPDGLVPRLLAERGYQVVEVSSRGVFGSEGDWRPWFNEQADARAIVAWIADQPWYSGAIGCVGASYLCVSHFALGVDPPVPVKVCANAVMSSNAFEGLYRGGSFQLESALAWAAAFEEWKLPTPEATRTLDDRLTAGWATLPLNEADAAAAGTRIEYFQEWLEYETADNPVWEAVTFRNDLDRMPPLSMVAGWFDPWCPGQLADFEVLQRAGRDVRITVGPWTHGPSASDVARDQLEWLDVHLKGKPRSTTSTVRVFVMGDDRWVDLPSWPPPADLTYWHLHPGGTLSTDPAPDSPADRYRYDPADPTPSQGGASLYIQNAGQKDQRLVEARPDVLTYTTEVLAEDVTVVGPVTAELHVKRSLDHTDFFVQLCDVHPDGRSMNVCNGLVRVKPETIDRQADGSFRVRIDLAPTANTFRRGHRIRVQVSSGAHPLFARNPGTGEPLGKATTLVAADQEVFHDPTHVSTIQLPVVRL